MSELREQVHAVVMRALRIYAPDEADTYGHDEAEMITDYVVPFIEARTRAVTETLAAIYAAAQANQPDEGKHELAVRIMRLAQGEQG